MDLGVPIGVDVSTGQPFCFDPWALYDAGYLTNPNMLLAGVIGQGKSALAKSLAIRAIAAGRQVFVPGDPKGEWGVVADAVGGTTIRLGPGLPARINPLDAAGPARVSVLAAIAEILLDRALSPAEHAALDAALEGLADRPADVGHVVRELTGPDAARAAADGTTSQQRAQDARDLIHALRRLTRGDLAGMVDGPSTTRPDPAAADDRAGPVRAQPRRHRPGRGHDQRERLARPRQVSRRADGPLRPRLVIHDEGWRLLQTPSQLRRMQAEWKLARATRTANLLIVHRFSDLAAAGDTGTARRGLAEGLLADCSVRIVYRQEADQLAAAADVLGLSPTQLAVVPALRRGLGLWTLGPRCHAVQHNVLDAESGVLDTDHPSHIRSTARTRCGRRSTDEEGQSATSWPASATTLAGHSSSGLEGASLRRFRRVGNQRWR